MDEPEETPDLEEEFEFPTECYPGMTPSQTIRSLALDRFARNVSPITIGRILGISHQTVLKWGRQHTVRAGSSLTAEDIRRRVKRVDAGSIVFDKATRSDHRLRQYNPATRRLLEFLAPENERTKTALSDLNGDRDRGIADAVRSLTLATDSYLQGLSVELPQIQDPKELVSALSAAVAIRSLTEVLQCPPPVASFGDVDKLIKILREAHSMGGGKDQQIQVGVNFDVLNHRPSKNARPSVVVEVEGDVQKDNEGDDEGEVDPTEYDEEPSEPEEQPEPES
jgi:hypothetical protein